MRRLGRASTTVLLYEETLLRLPDAYGPNIARGQLDALLATTPAGKHRVNTSWLGRRTAIRVLTRASGRRHLPNDFIYVRFASAERIDFIYTEENYGLHGGVVPHYNEDPQSVADGAQTFADMLDDALTGPDTLEWLVSVRAGLD